MAETTIGREPVQIVEIQQPLCENVFGVSPCTASGSDDTKCYNTRATCQDPANFALGDPLKLYFSKGQVKRFVPIAHREFSDWILADGTWDDEGFWRDLSYWKDAADREPGSVEVSLPANIIPSLVSVSTSPTQINLAGASPDAEGLGNRALCNIVLQDHQHTDQIVDPYVNGRSWNPLDASRGSFWSRWLVRNKYRQNIPVIVYEGYAGQTLAEMTSRRYFLQTVSGPDDGGKITIQGKDILAKLEERKSQAPIASPGELYIAINDSVTSFEVSNAVEADYAASGTIRVGDEIMTYTGRATSANGITFTGVTRGTDNSIAQEHDEETSVQQCLRYTGQRIDDVIEDLLTVYGGVPVGLIDTAGFQTEIDNYGRAYSLTTLITEPTAVAELISQIQVQALCYVWWDERDAKVKIKMIRGIEELPDLITDEANIIAGSYALTEKPRERASQVWVYFGRNDYVKAIDDPNAYESLRVIANLESESEALYGEASIRKIYANWLTTNALATNTATKIINRYVDIPSRLTLRLDAKDRDYWIGDVLRVSHHLDVDEFGARRIRFWTIVSAEEVVPGEVVEYQLEDTTLYGRIHFVMADDAPDYPGAASVPFRNCYIGNADGLLSDGSTAGRIS